MNKYYPGEQVNIHIQTLINSMQENNGVITLKKVRVKIPLLRGNGERVIPIYVGEFMRWVSCWLSMACWVGIPDRYYCYTITKKVVTLLSHWIGHGLPSFVWIINLYGIFPLWR